MTTFKAVAFASSLFAATTLFAQSAPPSQASGAPAPTAQPPVRIAQGSAAPGAATTGGQAAGAVVTEAGAATAAGAGFGIPAAIAGGLTAVGAASTNENGTQNFATTHH